MLIAEFELQGLPKMTNSSSRSSWKACMVEARKWKNLVHAECIKAKINNLELDKAQLTLTRKSFKEPDFDGLVSGFKHVIDGLKQAKVITDDRISNIGQPKYLWEHAPKGQGSIVIKIESE